MAINFNMNSQRPTTTAFVKKTPQRLVTSSDNSLHIYYGDSWLPLISPVRSVAFPGTRAAQTRTLTSQNITDTPNFSRPRKSINHHSHLPKLPNVLHKHRAAVGTATTTTTTTTTRRGKNASHADAIVQVWDSARADPEYGNGLQIRRLAGGMGIAIRGQYAERPRAGSGQVRHDAFLAHLVEGRMEQTMQALAAQVEEAVRRRGLRDLQTDICYRDDQTLDQDSGMIWNSQMIAVERRLNDRFICRAEELWGCTPRLHPYHLSGDQVGMRISGLADGNGTPERVVSVMKI